MKPKLFRLTDFYILVFPIVFIALISVAYGWNIYTDNNLPFEAYFIGVLVILACLAIIFVFYFQRYSWVKQYQYTTGHGIACYYEGSASIYSKGAVEKTTTDTLCKWRNWQGNGSAHYIKDTICIFKRAKTFTHTAPGWWTRKVHGIAGYDWFVVGQGNRSVSATAFEHELSHIYLNRVAGKMIDENRAHNIFNQVGIN